MTSPSFLIGSWKYHAINIPYPISHIPYPISYICCIRCLNFGIGWRTAHSAWTLLDEDLFHHHGSAIPIPAKSSEWHQAASDDSGHDGGYCRRLHCSGPTTRREKENPSKVEREWLLDFSLTGMAFPFLIIAVFVADMRIGGGLCEFWFKYGQYVAWWFHFPAPDWPMEIDIHLGIGRHQVFITQSRFASVFKVWPCTNGNQHGTSDGLAFSLDIHRDRDLLLHLGLLD